MKVAFVGSRDYPLLNLVSVYVAMLPPGSTVVSGGARGVDQAAEHAAVLRGLEALVFPADWDRYGKGAGYRRNRDIVAAADKVVAFWDGESKGTQHSFELAREMNKPLLVIGPNGQVLMQERWWNPGDRVCSIVDFDYATVVEESKEHPGYYFIELDRPDIDGSRVVLTWGGDLVRKKDEPTTV